MRRLVEEDEIRQAIFHPPETTRAYFRGRSVARFNREIASIQWDEVCFQHNGNLRTVNLPHPAHAKELAWPTKPSAKPSPSPISSPLWDRSEPTQDPLTAVASVSATPLWRLWGG